MKITVKQLQELGACKKQVELFEKMFGDETEVTVDNVLYADKTGLSVEWAVWRGLIPREIALADARLAYLYARDVDHGPRDDTRAAALRDPYYAYHYAREVDRAPRDDTRSAALSIPYYAYCYAREVDCGPRDDTRSATSKDCRLSLSYAKHLDKKG
jgi:hypothetical protein